jgi:hypothetical protein
VQSGSGGGIFSVIQSSTIVSNTTVTSTLNDTGVGLLVTGGALTFGNNIVAFNNDADNFQVTMGVTMTNQGHNLANGAIPGATPADLPNTDPQLGALANNGGPTLTYALSFASPAINAGANVNCPAADQRGVARPQAFICDIGAYERAFASALIMPFVANQSTP